MTDLDKNERLILELLSSAFIDIRMYAHEGNTKACFALSDLFNSVPGRIKVARSNGDGFDETIEWIKERAKEKNLQKWLQPLIDKYC